MPEGSNDLQAFSINCTLDGQLSQIIGNIVMLILARYILGVVFLFATINFGLKGFIFRTREPFDDYGYRMRAFYRTISTFCGFITFEMYYPTIDAIICLPVPLIVIWVNYLIAKVQMDYMKK